MGGQAGNQAVMGAGVWWCVVMSCLVNTLTILGAPESVFIPSKIYIQINK